MTNIKPLSTRIAYQIGEGADAERIISYRGTDNLNIFSGSPTDIGQYFIGAGFPINQLSGTLIAGTEFWGH